MNSIPTLCVIDDDEIYAFTVKRLVKITGMAQKIVFFENGQTAIDFFKANADAPDELPELVLLDLNMPILDGWQFMDQYMELQLSLSKQPAIYIISSSIDEADHVRAKAIPAVKDFIIKPINAETFKQIILNL